MSRPESDSNANSPPRVASLGESELGSSAGGDKVAVRGLVVVAVKPALQSPGDLDPRDSKREFGSRGRATAEIVLGLACCPTALIVAMAFCVRACAWANQWGTART